MFNLQGSEIIVILLIALVVLGPDRLPDAVRRFMHTYNELKKMGNGFQSEIKAAFDEPMREMRDTAQMVRDAADPSKLMAEAEAEQRLNGTSPTNGTAATNGAATEPEATKAGDDPAPTPAPDPSVVSTPTPPPPPPRPSPPPANSPPQTSAVAD